MAWHHRRPRSPSTHVQQRGPSGRLSCRTSRRPGPKDRTCALFLAGELVYVLDLARSTAAGGLLIELLTRERRKSGEWGKPKPVIINRHDIATLPDERDRRILDAVCGATHAHEYFGPSWSGYSAGVPVPAAFVLNVTLQRDLARQLAETGPAAHPAAGVPAALRATTGLVPIDWDPVPAQFLLRIAGDDRAGYTIGGVIHRGEQAHAVGEVMFATAALVVWRPVEPAPGRA